MEAELWVGVDVSKARLDVALGESGELYRLTNDQRGIQELIARLRTLDRARGGGGDRRAGDRAGR